MRAKGQVGEREIADDLNYILKAVHEELGLQAPEKPLVQRNQNQSAVGGCDLVGTFGLAIEVKRQEQLSINTWWAQCVKSAKELNEHPVLLFRQNAKPGLRTKWRCLTLVELVGSTAQCEPSQVRAEMEYEDFKEWFRKRVRTLLKAQFPFAQEARKAQWPPPPPVVDDGPRVEATRSAA